MVVSSCDSHECLLRKPCWRGVNILCFSSWVRTCLQIMCSRILEHMQVSETGRYFSGSCVLPFLKTGETKAAFQSGGMVPCSRDWRKKADKSGAMSVASSLNTLAGILSGPAALQTFRFCRSFATPKEVMSRSLILG